MLQADVLTLLNRPKSLPDTGLVQELEGILNGVAQPLSRGEEARSLSALVHLVHWLSRPGPISTLDTKAPVPRHPSSTRLWLLIRFLQENPIFAARIGNRFRMTFAKTDAVSLFCDTGLSNQHGFIHEFMERVTGKVIPAALDERQFASVLRRMFPTAKSVAWAEAIPHPMIDHLTELLFPEAGDYPFDFLRDDLADALNILAGRVSSLGLQQDVRVRCAEHQVRTSPFLNLPRLSLRITDAVLTLPHGSPMPDEVIADLAEWRNEVGRTREIVASVFEHLEEFGVGVDLVFRLELIQRQLERMELLMSRLAEDSGEELRYRRADLFLFLVRQGLEDSSLRVLIQGGIHRLSRKVIESTGAAGEHYITSNRAEYRAMLLAALGGGLVMAFATLVKYGVTSLTSLPLFFEGLLTSANYAASFLLIQFFGFTLATKQPASIAATLSVTLEQLENWKRGGTELIDLIARTTRSQIAAFAGNLVMVVPAVLFLDLLWSTMSGHTYLTPEKAGHVLESFNPFQSLSIFYATLTGVMLWVSSLFGGWLENWFSYHRIVDVIRSGDGLGFIGSQDRRNRVADWLRQNIAGIGSNASLGVMLGMTAITGKFFGLPLDVRHVTLAAGSIAFAASSIGFEVFADPHFYPACLGLVFIGLLNFSVSFSLALLLASRARGITVETLLKLPVRIYRTFTATPMKFLFPPADEQPAAGVGEAVK